MCILYILYIIILYRIYIYIRLYYIQYHHWHVFYTYHMMTPSILAVQLQARLIADAQQQERDQDRQRLINGSMG